MPSFLILGLGYTAQRLAARLLINGWDVTGVNQSGRSIPGLNASVICFEDQAAVSRAIAESQAILSSVPPVGDMDPVLDAYGAALRAAPAAWIGYLSSTGVYGDTRGAWVDETSAVGLGRRSGRTSADIAWSQFAHVFRLPGIYGPGRSALDRVRDGTAHRIDLPNHVFCRIHVDDIVTVLMASLAHPGAPQIYNVADDEPASGSAVTAFACDLLGKPYPPLQSLDEAGLSAMARSFYSECRRVRAERIKTELGVSLAYPTYRHGLEAILAEEHR